MDVLEAGFSLVKYLAVGLALTMGVLFLLAVLFGKRKHTRWEYEAEFLNDGGREIGEFDVELSKVDKEDEDYVLRAKLRFRHEALVEGVTVDVLLDGVKIFGAPVESPGRVFFESAPLIELAEPQVGQVCGVRVGDRELASAPLKLD